MGLATPGHPGPRQPSDRTLTSGSPTWWSVICTTTSSISWTTDAAGARAREVAYWPYGQVLYASAILPATPAEARGFVGEQFDAGARLRASG